VAAWNRVNAGTTVPVWRPWEGAGDLYTTASFPLVPWSNRITRNGFEHGDTHHAIAPNRAGEPYPIHGDGWLQAWSLHALSPHAAEMVLESHNFAGNPYHYRAVQRFELHEGGMEQTLTVTHCGDTPLPYGLGQHPAFTRTPACRLQAAVAGVWLCGADPIPTRHTQQFPQGWDLNPGQPLDSGGLIDNAFSGWSGQACIEWPEHGLRLDMQASARGPHAIEDQYCLLYRPPQGGHFCFEPVTHPIDAFHMPGSPGLQVLAKGESLTLRVRWSLSGWV
jgi:aldose 1-epimerase